MCTFIWDAAVAIRYSKTLQENSHTSNKILTLKPKLLLQITLKAQEVTNLDLMFLTKLKSVHIFAHVKPGAKGNPYQNH